MDGFHNRQLTGATSCSSTPEPSQENLCESLGSRPQITTLELLWMSTYNTKVPLAAT